MQPFETRMPSNEGRFVPWMATGPALRPARQHPEKAEMPIAAQPYGPSGSAWNLWLM
jgi:hypothetical protein